MRMLVGLAVLLRRVGYVPLDEHTGMTEELGAMWPEAHKIATPGGVDDGHHDGTTWFVRSPWPAISVDDIFFRVLWNWVDREPHDDVRWAERVVEVFSWDESKAISWMNTNASE